MRLAEEVAGAGADDSERVEAALVDGASSVFVSGLKTNVSDQ